MQGTIRAAVIAFVLLGSAPSSTNPTLARHPMVLDGKKKLLS
jgi:hypothetical protein